MAATRVYSTAAYYVAAIVAIIFGLSPKFGALVASVPGGVLGGITVVLYGMIGLLGAKIWKENGVDFGNPINLVPDRGRHHHRHRQRLARLHRRTSRSSGIALGTIVAIVALPPGPRPRPGGPARPGRRRERHDDLARRRQATTATATASTTSTRSRPGGPDLRRPLRQHAPTAPVGPRSRHRGPTAVHGRSCQRSPRQRCRRSPSPTGASEGRIGPVKPAPFVHHAPRTVERGRRACWPRSATTARSSRAGRA